MKSQLRIYLHLFFDNIFSQFHQDEIKLDLQFGVSPNFRDGSHILVEKEAEGSEGWHLTYDRISGTHVTCSLHIPAKV